MFSNEALTEQTPRLEKFAYRLAKNTSDASDLMQATLLRALEKKHLFKDGTNLFGWLSKIMYNLFVSQYRRKTKFETAYDPEPYIERQSVAASQEKALELRKVDAALNTLSREHKSVLVMVCVKGMKYEEVAKKLSIPVGTVRSRLSRARLSLKDAVENVANDTYDYTPNAGKPSAIEQYCMAAA